MNIIDTRINKLRELMSDNGISFYIIPTMDSHGSEYIDEYFKCREFMSGFTGSAGTLVVSMDEAALFVDGRYHIQADIETNNNCIAVYKLGASGVPTMAKYLRDKAKKSDLIAFNGRTMMSKDFMLLKEKVDCQFDYELDLVAKMYEKRQKMKANPVILLSEELTGENTSSKIEKVRGFICDKHADAVFVSSLDDICYLINIRGTDIAYSTVCFSYLYITKDSATVYLQRGTYDNELVDALEKQGVYIADYNDVEIELFKIKGKRVLIDDEYTSAYFKKVLSLGNETISVNNFSFVNKHIKNKTEQDLARKYAVIDAISMIEFIVSIKEKIKDNKITEYDAAMMLDDLRKSNDGFFGLSFETISAYAENAAIVHYSPDENGSKLLETKGLLLIDSGAHYFGATTDITRTICLGNISDEEKHAYTLVLKGNLKLMDAVFIKGTRCENLDILAREPLWKEGLDYRHGTGHGIGSFLNVHEGPYRIGYRIREDMPQPEIEEGMIISDEPGYYEQDKYGIRHETQLLCVKNYDSQYGKFLGFEPLSLVPFEKDAIDFSMLNEDELNILKQYNSIVNEKVGSFLSESAKKWLDYNTNYVD